MDIFEQQKKSELTIRQFCQKIGISMTQFYYHRRRDSRPQEKRSGPAFPLIFFT
ncbi:IS66 family insertion sequence element accessory protein TnpA [Xenorhabdus bovienii]|uniref:IS66 family insertion sequence element accessory protein TnpA n=1 Tax=Xenorhabdus bovienii TaxID=40576 RepID=UPI0023B2315A|nr:hypothetical protein [Xenorhabdus bovienii]MDE9539780.1 hypothetical protein [Xenorhabdus bovienii]